MSAFKTATVRIGEEEYRRLREAEEKLRVLEIRKAAQEKPEHNFGTILREVEDDARLRREEYAGLAASFGQEIENVEARTTRALQHHVTQIARSLTREQEDAQAQIGGEIEHWVDAFGTVFDQQQAQLEAMWSAQENRLLSEQQRWQFFAGESERWLDACREWIETTIRSYPHESMAPGELQLYVEEMDWVEQIRQQGMADIAAPHARQLFTQVLRFQQRLEADWSVVVTLHRHLLHVLDDLRAQVRQNREVAAMDLEGNLLDERVDVDYWQPGKLEGLLKRIDQLELKITTRDYIPREELIAVLEEQVPELQRAQVELVSQARFAALSSQLRYNIAQIVLNALQEQGFYALEAHYENNDYRGSIEATTQNSSKSKVTVTIDPARSVVEGGVLKIRSNDGAEITEHELRERNREIFASLAGYGLKVENVKEVAEPEGIGAPPSPYPPQAERVKRGQPLARPPAKPEGRA